MFVRVCESSASTLRAASALVMAADVLAAAAPHGVLHVVGNLSRKGMARVVLLGCTCANDLAAVAAAALAAHTAVIAGSSTCAVHSCDVQ